MIHSIVFGLIIISVIITADPGPISDTGSYAAQQPPPPPPSRNYYDYRSQQQTPSPYTGKRNQNSNNYPDQPSQSSSIAATYGNPPKKSSANQCKLHINCPSN